MQKQCFLASSIEDERVASFEPRHELPFTSLVGEEECDRVLLHRLSPRTADVDQLGALARLFEYPRWNLVIVNHDIRTSQAFEAVNGDEARVSGSGPDQINSRILHW